MKQLYKYNDLYGVVINIFEFLKPSHICDMVKKKNDSSTSLACTAHYFHNISKKYILPQYTTCEIRTLKNSTKRCCRIHCKAFPILSLLYKPFDNFQRAGLGDLRGGQDYIHYNCSYIANFLPQHIPSNIQLIKRCCGGKGWKFIAHRPEQEQELACWEDIPHRNQLPAAV